MNTEIGTTMIDMGAYNIVATIRVCDLEERVTVSVSRWNESLITRWPIGNSVVKPFVRVVLGRSLPEASWMKSWS